jgi:hypothetical protein
LVLLVTVPVSLIDAVNVLNVPVLDSVKLVRFSVVVPGLKAVVPKLNVLNQLLVVNVAIELPEINVRLGLLVTEPAVVPNVNVLVTDIVLENPPVPVYVKLEAFAISRLVAAAVVVANTILLAPNVILRTLALVELNVPVVKSNPFRFNVPAVSVVIAVAASVNVPPKLVVIPVPLISNDGNVVLVLLVIVPVPTMVGVNVVNVPPLDNVKPKRFSDVVPGLNAVVPKFNVLNQLPVVNVAIAVPLPVNVKLHALAAVPPAVLPSEYVLVTFAFVVNPPVPVTVKLVVVAICKTVVVAVV